MELKLPEACPLWLTHALTEVGAFPTSFSKYGTCYKEHIFEKGGAFQCLILSSLRASPFRPSSFVRRLR